MRPKMLGHCLNQLSNIRLPDSYRVILIVVDNDEKESARAIFEASPVGRHLECHYVVEPERGLSQVRNRCLKEAIARGTEWLAFMDDDEFPDRDWLATLLAAQARFQAKIVQAPVIQVPWEDLAHFDLSQARPKSNHPSGTPVTHVNAGNVLFHLAEVKRYDLRFDPYFQFIAGEDHDFFDRLVEHQGQRAIWCAEALAYEAVVADRLNLSGRLSRSYSGGIANVAKFRHRHSRTATALYFLNKSFFKTLTGTVKVLVGLVTSKTRLRTGLRDVATAVGYLAGLTGRQVQNYRTPDGQ